MKLVNSMNNNYKSGVFWDRISSKTKSNFEVLSSSLSADIAIVGGGIVGLSIAIEASNNGYNVVVLEKCQIEYPNGGGMNQQKKQKHYFVIILHVDLIQL